MTVKPGVLALQGSVEPHAAHLRQLGHEAVAVRLPSQLDDVTHLIVPGGESTTIAKLLEFYELWDPIATRARDGSLAVFGTCAGTILIGRESDERPRRMDLLDLDVDRNAFGRQVDSFVAPLESERFPELEGVFIRAPRIREVGPAVEVLATWESEPVLVTCARILAATFHPELTGSTDVHDFFLQI